MIAAASPDRDRDLGTFKLVLLMEAKGQAYSTSLQEYFSSVVSQSFELLDDPEEIAGEALAESLALALRIQASDTLRDELSAILEGNVDKEVLASRALSNLETTFDPSLEPAHFGREVYAAI